MLTVLMTRAFDRFFFFFSSRRRHTRCSRDWSSDVCSSDLQPRLQTGQQTSDVGLGFPHVPAARLARGFGGATDFPAFLGSHGAYPTRDRPGHLAATHRRRLATRSEEHTSELQSRLHLVCRLLLEKKNNNRQYYSHGNYFPSYSLTCYLHELLIL